MNSAVDQPAAVRPGEELAIAALENYLSEHFPEASGPLTVQQFPHGHSNLTYLLRRGTSEWVLRRPPFGNQVKTAHDMGREYRVLSKLSPVFPAAPRPFLSCEDDRVLGAPFYLMERRHGVILRKELPRGLAPDRETTRHLGVGLIDTLAQLHALDYRDIGLGALGRPEGYVARQVTGWTNRAVQARTEDVPAMERVALWLAEHLPPETGAALVHNDYKHDNLVLDPQDLTHIVGVLDWEMATVGDPLMDLGTTLGYWIEPGDPPWLQLAARGPTTLPGSPTRRALIERYAQRTGRDVSNVVFYYCFGLFKIAVIVQQIYARYVRGHTRDPRFAKLNEIVAILSQQAVRALETDGAAV